MQSQYRNIMESQSFNLDLLKDKLMDHSIKNKKVSTLMTVLYKTI